MGRWAAVMIVCVLGATLVVPGCREVSDTLNAGENERASNEANRRRFHQERKEARQRKMEPVLRKAKKAPKEPIVKLDPESPEGILFAELSARLECRDDTCRSAGLQRIRRHAAQLLPALPKLLNGQSETITIEALRLAGLFKAKGAVDAVARTLLLGSKRAQEEAVWSLGAIGDRRGVEPLRRFSALDHPPRVMAAICRSLGQIGGLGALKPIEAVFMQGTAETRVECLEAAARLTTPKARALFERAVKDPRPEVATLATTRLAELAPDAPEVSENPGEPTAK